MNTQRIIILALNHTIKQLATYHTVLSWFERDFQPVPAKHMPSGWSERILDNFHPGFIRIEINQVEEDIGILRKLTALTDDITRAEKGIEKAKKFLTRGEKEFSSFRTKVSNHLENAKVFQEIIKDRLTDILNKIKRMVVELELEEEIIKNISKAPQFLLQYKELLIFINENHEMLKNATTDHQSFRAYLTSGILTSNFEKGIIHQAISIKNSKRKRNQVKNLVGQLKELQKRLNPEDLKENSKQKEPGINLGTLDTAYA